MQNTEERKYHYDTAFEQVKYEVDSLLSTSPLVIRSYTKHLAASMGKFIRAASVITCAMDREGLIREKAVKMAAAIRDHASGDAWYTTTSLITRISGGGEPTLQKKYGKKNSGHLRGLSRLHGD